MPIKTLLALETEALFLKVFADWSLLLDVLVQKCAVVTITTISTEPKGTNFQFMFGLIMPNCDGFLDA